MPFLIATKRKSGTQALVTGNATNQQRYTNLKSTFAVDELYRLFAEPAESPRDISWYTDWDIDESQPPITLGEIEATDPTRAADVRGRVASAMDLFYARIKQYEQNPQQYQRLLQVLKDSFELPEAQTNVWVLTDKTGQERLVLTQWGYLKDEFNPERDIINQWPRHRRRNVGIQASFAHNGQPAPNQTLYISKVAEPAEAILQIQTDSTGYALLANVLPDTLLQYDQQNGDNLSINQGTFRIDERDVYPIQLDQWGSLSLLIEQHGQPKSGETFVIEFDGKRIDAVSDANGLIQLPALKAGTPIRVYQQKDGQLLNEYQLHSDPDQSQIRLTLADTIRVESGLSTTEVILQNRRREPVANGQVRLWIGGQSVDRTLDQNGATLLSGVKPGESVKLEYLDKTGGQQVKWRGSFTRKPDQESYILVMKRRWWWLWLLGLLLLLLLLLGLRQCQHTVVVIDKPKVIIDRGDQEKIQPCNASTKAGTNQISVLTYSLGKPKGEFKITYWTGNTYPDEIIIYEGADTTGRVLFRTDGKIITDNLINRSLVQSGLLDGNIVDRLDPQGQKFNILFLNKAVTFDNPKGLVTVVVKPETSDQTQWEYIVNCPD